MIKYEINLENGLPHTVTNSKFGARMGHTCTLQNFEIPDGGHTGLGIFLMVVLVCIVKCPRMSPKTKKKSCCLFSICSHHGFVKKLSVFYNFKCFLLHVCNCAYCIGYMYLSNHKFKLQYLGWCAHTFTLIF